MFIVHCSIAIYGVPAGQSDSDCIPSISREEWTANSIRRLERPSQGKRSVPRDNSCARVAGVAPRELEISRPGWLPRDINLRPTTFLALPILSANRRYIVPT